MIYLSEVCNVVPTVLPKTPTKWGNDQNEDLVKSCDGVDGLLVSLSLLEGYINLGLAFTKCGAVHWLDVTARYYLVGQVGQLTDLLIVLYQQKYQVHVYQ